MSAQTFAKMISWITNFIADLFALLGELKEILSGLSLGGNE